MHEPITVAAFEIWFRAAKRGDKFVYHVGLLYHDRTDWTTYRPIEPLNSLADRVWERHEHGDVVLVQTRTAEPGVFLYEAVRT